MYCYPAYPGSIGEPLLPVRGPTSGIFTAKPEKMCPRQSCARSPLADGRVDLTSAPPGYRLSGFALAEQVTGLAEILDLCRDARRKNRKSNQSDCKTRKTLGPIVRCGYSNAFG